MRMIDFRYGIKKKVKSDVMDIDFSGNKVEVQCSKENV